MSVQTQNKTMALFQKSVLHKYLKTLDDKKVQAAYQKFTAFFHNETIIQNIREDKEEQFQYGFLQNLFDVVLGYTINPNPDYNLTTELKNLKGAKKADGAILKDGKAVGVIELKSTKTKQLSKITDQAFGYKNNHPTCVYIITSNFEKLRFYINDAVDYIDFDLFTLKENEFRLLYLCLHKEHILSDLPLKIKHDSTLEEENITKKLYKDYSAFKKALFNDLVMNNPDIPKLTLFKKSQKLIDRFLFILFAEDKGLLPPNSITKIVKTYDTLKEADFEKPLYEVFQQYFGYINTGRPAKGDKAEIFAFNGGLFAPDATLDQLTITDNILMNHTLLLSAYDFESEVDVNILGHIFEHSLNEIDEITAELEGQTIDKSKTKRKKDGVFYTPKYITKYIVDNTIGKLCTSKKESIGLKEEEYKPKRNKATKKRLLEVLENYRSYLLGLTICDPACGSGAFLNQALDFLIKEHRYIDELQTKLLGGSIILSDITNDILERNIYGVDINEESVEIARLSLWLRTAQKGRTLTSLSDNIKCGNSLIDDPAVAGDKAFNWHTEFPSVFRLKEKQAFHLVLTTHNSRTSQRMIDYNVQKGDPIELNLEEEIALTKIFADLIAENGYHCLAYNVCKDHVHLVLVCEAGELTEIIKILKGKSAYLFRKQLSKGFQPLEQEDTNEDSSSNGLKPIGGSHDPLKHKGFWSQKFYHAALDEWTLATTSNQAGYLQNDSHLGNAIAYIQTNRSKHELPESKALQKLIDAFITTQDTAFAPEYGGGFDVVIGNPPYVRQELISDIKPYLEKHYKSFAGTADLFTYFYEKGIALFNEKGLLSFITNDFNKTTSSAALRKFLQEKTNFISFDDLSDVEVFKGTTTYPIILTLSKEIDNEFHYCKYKQDDTLNLDLAFDTKKVIVNQSLLDANNWTFKSNLEVKIINKLLSNSNIKNQFKKCYYGVKTGLNEAFITNEDFVISNNVKKYYEGKDLKKWHSPPIDKKLILFESKSTKSNYGELEEEEAINKISQDFPNLFNHLLQFKEKAKKRYDKGEYWWELRNCAYYHLFENPKIVFPNLQNGNKFSFDNTGTYINAPAVILPTDDIALLAILNSKCVWYFLNQICVVRSGGYIEVKPQYFEQIPIPSYSNQKNNLIAKTESQILNTSKFQTIESKFLRLIQRKFPIDKLSKKLQNWHTLTFAEFVKELKKKKIKLGLAEEAEWEDYFEAEKAKALTLQATIDQTDKEIDQMVYALYGLTEEEIEIVENG